MSLDSVLIGFAFTAGTVAFLNPCGFAMLPTYVSYFVESDTQRLITATSSSRSIMVRRFTKGGLMGLLATTAFIAIFGVAGIAIASLGIGIVRFLPWAAVLSGVVIIGIGVAKIFGKNIHINIPTPRGLIHDNSSNNPNSNSDDRKKLTYVNFFLFGIGYSIASLSCTLPLFLLVVFQGLSAGGIKEGSIAFLAYALGMGIIMIAISVAISASNQTFVRWLGKLAPKMNIITSVVLVLGGSYLIYYNLVVGKLLA
jgi:cytochrome c-type biogenesis protein